MSTTSAPTSHIDRDLEALRAGAERWANLPAANKSALLARVRDAVAAQAGRWSVAGAKAKGIAGTRLEGEEWISGPWAVLYALNRYIETLSEIARSGRPQIDPRRVRTRADGQIVVEVFPNTLYDQLLFNGIRADVWMQPGVSAESLPSTLGTWYQQETHEPRVALVLGAGNISSIAPLDVLYKLVADGAVCILKMNPVNEYLGPVFEDALKPLVDEGFLRFTYGGSEAGKYLCNHPLIDEIHITGSDRTHDAIVYGDGPDAADRKRRNDPLLHKPITSELGNVSPTIVVPGAWSDADFRFQAENIVTQKLHNAGFNCIAAQVLILPSEWDGTPKLLDAIDTVLREVLDRPAYYPGAAERQTRLAAHRTRVRYHGRSGGGFVPRTLVHADAAANDAAFQDEAFSSILAVTTLPGDVESYVARAVSFANESLRGTLGANIIVHPKTQRDHAHALDAAIADLRYGCIGVNVWTGVGYFISETPWGAFPGHTLDDIGSGIGVVHNSHLFSRSQKAVVSGPFAPFPRSFAGYGNSLLPKPPWFVTHRSAANVGRWLCQFEGRKTPLAAAMVAHYAVRG